MDNIEFLIKKIKGTQIALTNARSRTGSTEDEIRNLQEKLQHYESLLDMAIDFEWRDANVESPLRTGKYLTVGRKGAISVCTYHNGDGGDQMGWTSVSGQYDIRPVYWMELPEVPLDRRG